MDDGCTICGGQDKHDKLFNDWRAAEAAASRLGRKWKEGEGEITSLRAELEIWRRITSLRAELAAIRIAANAAENAMNAAAHHDTEEIARLREALEPFAKLNVTRFMTDGCRYEFRIDAAWIRGARAALANPPEVRVQAHGPFPGAPFSPPKGDK